MCGNLQKDTEGRLNAKTLTLKAAATDGKIHRIEVRKKRQLSNDLFCRSGVLNHETFFIIT